MYVCKSGPSSSAYLDRALFQAAGSGDADSAEALLRMGADPSRKTQSMESGTFQESGRHFGFPVIRAAGAGHSHMVKLLVRHGARLDVVNSAGRTALIEAVVFGGTEVVGITNSGL